MPRNLAGSSPRVIETVWNGYRCRSRLEARWLVFLDHMGIEFDYEPEGFDLPGVGWYLPDLWLPQIGHWAEVKPSWFKADETAKMWALARHTGKHALFLDSRPDFRAYEAITQDCGELDKGPYSLDVAMYPKAYHQEHRLWFAPVYAGEPEDFSEEYREAVRLSRAARFER